MGKGRDVVIAEHRPGTLDRMHGPEDPGHQFLVFAGFVQFKQGEFQFREEFVGLIPEGLTMEVDHPRTFLITARSCSG